MSQTNWDLNHPFPSIRRRSKTVTTTTRTTTNVDNRMDELLGKLRANSYIYRRQNFEPIDWSFKNVEISISSESSDDSDDTQSDDKENSVIEEARGGTHLELPRHWPEVSLKSPGIEPRNSCDHHLSALQSLDSNSQIEESVDESQTHNTFSPQTASYSANNYGDHSVFAPVFIGGGSTYRRPSYATAIHSTPLTPSAWTSMSNGVPPNPSTPPPLPPRTRHLRNSTPMSSDVSSPQSRFAPTFIVMPNSYEDQSPSPLPPRWQTFSELPSNSSHSRGVPLAGQSSKQLRRSQRRRIPPLEYWRGQRAVYKRDSFGTFVIVGVTDGYKDVL